MFYQYIMCTLEPYVRNDVYSYSIGFRQSLPRLLSSSVQFLTSEFAFRFGLHLAALLAWSSAAG